MASLRSFATRGRRTRPLRPVALDCLRLEGRALLTGPTYIDLGPNTAVEALNNSGEAGGVVISPGVVVAGIKFYQDGGYDILPSGDGGTGFLRDAAGNVTDLPFAVVALNDSGEAAGEDPSVGAVLRDAAGDVTAINDPSAYGFTVVNALSNSGEAAGYYVKSFGPPVYIPLYSGFLRDAAGNYTDVTYFNNGLNGGYDQSPMLFALNNSGEAGGFGYLRQPNGTIIPLSDPPALVSALNDTGEAGGYETSYGAPVHANEGFLRAPDGTMTWLDLGLWTAVNALNNSGEAGGFYEDSSNHFHGFIRDASGNVTTIDLGTDTETVVTSINNQGEVGGFFLAADGTLHGFLIPAAQPHFENLSLSLNPSGGVKFSYTVAGGDLTADASIQFYWVDAAGDRTPLPELTTNLPAGPNGLGAEGTHPLSRPNITTLPPAGTTGLLMVVGPDVPADRLTIDYDASFSLDASVNGSEAPGVIGRFFSGVGVVPGANANFEKVTFTLPDDLLALKPTSVMVTVGGQPLTATTTDGVTYATAAFNPTAFAGGTPLVVKVLKGAAVVGSETDTLDVLPLPTWFTKSLSGRTALFDPASGTYTLAGSLFNVTTSSIPGFQLGSQLASIWFGGMANNGLDANASVVIIDGLDRLKAPNVRASLAVQLTFLGEKVVDIAYSDATATGPFIFTMNLDPGTLALSGATLGYTESGITTTPALPNQVLKINNFATTKSNVTASLNYTLDVKLALNTDGSIKSSDLGFVLNGGLSGTLTDLSLTPPPAPRSSPRSSRTSSRQRPPRL